MAEYKITMLQKVTTQSCDFWVDSVAEPAKAGNAVVVPKQTGSRGFYKVWVSDAPIVSD